MIFNKIWLACDHAGLNLKEFLAQQYPQFHDLGCFSRAATDYPDIVQTLSENFKEGDGAILVCGSGIGMSMAANRLPFLRAALCTQAYEVLMARSHNDANVLCLGQRVVGEGVAQHCIDSFINTPFSGEKRHTERLQKMSRLQKEPESKA